MRKLLALLVLASCALATVFLLPESPLAGQEGEEKVATLSIKGYVVDWHGNPVKGATIELSDDGYKESKQSFKVGDDGYVRLLLHPEDGNFWWHYRSPRLTVNAQGFGSRQAYTSVQSGDQRSFIVRLPRSVKVELTYTNCSSASLRFEVWPWDEAVAAPSSSDNLLLAAEYEYRKSDPNTLVATATNSDPWDRANYSGKAVTVINYGGQPQYSEPFDWTPGKPMKATMGITARYDLKGMVKGFTYGKVNQLTVHMQQVDRDGPSAQATPDESGEFTFFSMLPGEYYLFLDQDLDIEEVDDGEGWSDWNDDSYIMPMRRKITLKEDGSFIGDFTFDFTGTRQVELRINPRARGVARLALYDSDNYFLFVTDMRDLAQPTKLLGVSTGNYQVYIRPISWDENTLIGSISVDPKDRHTVHALLTLPLPPDFEFRRDVKLTMGEECAEAIGYGSITSTRVGDDTAISGYDILHGKVTLKDVLLNRSQIYYLDEEFFVATLTSMDQEEIELKHCEGQKLTINLDAAHPRHLPDSIGLNLKNDMFPFGFHCVLNRKNLSGCYESAGALIPGDYRVHRALSSKHSLSLPETLTISDTEDNVVSGICHAGGELHVLLSDMSAQFVDHYDTEVEIRDSQGKVTKYERVFANSTLTILYGHMCNYEFKGLRAGDYVITVKPHNQLTYSRSVSIKPYRMNYVTLTSAHLKE